jgi:hypothetical protein
VSYFSLGSVQEGDQRKDTWLWTTIGDGVRNYDFDSLRIFVWSGRRHRYETEYIEKNLIGYSPVKLEPVHWSSGKGKNAESGQDYPGFSLCVQKKDGQRYRRQYAVLGNAVRFAGEEPCEAPSTFDFDAGSAPVTAPPPAAQPTRESLTQRVKRRLKAFTGHWFGH